MVYYIVIRGPAAGGKTTISKRLARKLDALYISFDEIRDEHGIGLSEEDRIRANDVAIPEAKRNLERGRIVIFDGVFYHRSQLDHLFRNLRFRHFVFTLRASLERCLERHKERESEISEKSVRDVHGLVNTFDSGTVIDTDGRSEEETVSEIISRLP